MRVSRECPTEHALDSVHPVKANRPRGMRSKAEGEPMAVLPAIVPAPRLAPTEATRRWAALTVAGAQASPDQVLVVVGSFLTSVAATVPWAKEVFSFGR